MILPPAVALIAIEMILPPAVALIATEMILPPHGNNSHRSDIDTGVDSIIATCRGDSYYHLIATI